MKTILKNLIAAAFVVGLATSVSAAAPGKGGTLKTGIYKQAGTLEQIQSLKKGHHYAMVCMECKSISVNEVSDEKEVEALCHDGGTVHCNSCKAKATIKHSGPPGKGTTSAKVTYVNSEGKECMIIVPVND